MLLRSNESRMYLGNGETDRRVVSPPESALLFRSSGNVGLCSRFFGAVVIGHVVTAEAMGEAGLDLRQHRGVPVEPLPLQPAIVVLLTVLQVGALQRVGHDVKEECIVEDLEELEIAIAHC